ncbi:hypothetical protein N7474_008288 [Penicillium riverlandense]|uniref:uncharacterized protein n=1 Tax=Penicillium riverlandense TaxID=1903569 RepID=UPI002548A58A|nr:uncharacterized protein N7474_008288 [Penicillium riverlandense]KAJ5811987.1 hypothetical protein N7474_008288 [Penicillium riverlandense]
MVEILGPVSPTRPPTPPRTASRFVSVDENNPTGSPIVVQTPGESPFTVVGSAGAPPSSRSSKRVNFSPWNKYIKPPTFANPSSNKNPPPSNELRPAKSILKATQSPIPVWSPNADTFTTESLAMLLESVIQQLASESLSSRLDAYMQFFGALRTYEGLPAGQDIADKLGLITEFIQRDVSRDLVNGKPMDTNLANQALKLSAAFVWHAEISTQLSDDFKMFLVEQCITSLREAKVPKSVLSHYMNILTTQNFGPKIMNHSRVTRLLTELHDINKRVPGNAIVTYQLGIYQRLLTQSKTAFISQSEVWIEHLIFGLLHHLKDIRLKAISLGFQISAAGMDLVLSRNIRDLFDRPLENDRNLGAEIRERMSRMMASTESGVHVPQIWSVIVLLLRSKRWSLEKWDQFREWVLVLQKCFNCSEQAIKAQAIIGWNRFVFAVGPSESTSLSLLKMLGKPILTQFERRKADRSWQSPTNLALSSYYNLLYYAFRPSTSYRHLDRIWDEYVAAPSSGAFSSVPALNDCACCAIANLLWSSQAKVWSETRITDNERLQPEELLSIDSKWVRSRISEVLKVFEHLFKSSVWSGGSDGLPNVALAWTNLANALSFASSKEITPSGESMQAVASVLGLLQRLWTAGPSSLNATGEQSDHEFLARFQLLSTKMIYSLGSIPFTEKLLSRVADETFQISNTPSHHRTGPDSNLHSSILHLLQMISDPGKLALTPSYKDLVTAIVQASCNGRISRWSRLELLQQFTELRPAGIDSRSRELQVSEEIWKTVAQEAAEALRSFPIESARERDGSVSRDYENINKILSSGLHFSNTFKEWSHLLDSFFRVVRTEKGDRLLATMIVEPMAEILLSLPARAAYMPASSLLGHALSIPFFQDPVTGGEYSGSGSLEETLFPHKLLEFVGTTLCRVYESFDASDTDDLAHFVESLTSFMSSGFPSLHSKVLETLQPSLCLWLKDEACQIDIDRGANSRILTACRTLSSVVVHILQTDVSHDLPSLQRFEAIICSGLESSHTSTVKRFAELWGSTFGLQESLACPAVQQALHTAKLRLQAPVSQPQSDIQMNDSLSSMCREGHDQPTNELPGVQDSAMQLTTAELKSSPVIRAQDSSSMLPPQRREPAISQPEAPEEQITESTPVTNNRQTRREVFRMIEAIHSSSPAPTPGKSGLQTPTHLRRLHRSESANDLLLTPTFGAAEHEGFLGSSPTPGTREPTPAASSEMPHMTTTHDIEMSMETDIPSSPPELHSGSPSPRKNKKSRGARRRSARRKATAARSGKQDPVSNPTVSNLDMAEDSAATSTGDTEVVSSQEPEMPLGGRLRSASGKVTPAEPKSAPTAPVESSATTETVETPTRDTAALSSQKTASTAKSKKSKRKSTPKPKPQETQQETEELVGDTASAPGAAVPDDFVDSASEDVDTQIASQLEQDYQLSRNVAEPENSASHAEQHSGPATRKRKRQEETRSSSRMETRRSSQRSATKELVPEAAQTETVESQSLAVPDATPRVSADKESPVLRRRSTRSSQLKEVESALPDSIPLAQEARQDSALQETVQEAETPQPPSKRIRKSLPRPVAEESPAKNTPSRETRSSRRRSQPSQIASQSESLQEADTQFEQSASQGEPQHDETLDLDLVSETTLSPDKPVEPIDLTVSFNVQPDTQMNDVEPSTESRSVNLDIAMAGVSTDGPADAPVAKPVPNIAHSTTQTDEQVPSSIGADSSEAGISRSLSKILENMKTATLSPTALRDIDDLLFNIRVEAHEAFRRHNHSA